MTDVSIIDGTISDETFIVGNDVAVIETTSTADDAAFFSRNDQTAWVVNPENGAVSMYANWGFTSMATLADGRVLAAGEGGLFLLGGDLDGVDAIPAAVGFGPTDFGGYDRFGAPTTNDFLKRVSEIWLGYRSTGALSVSVTATGSAFGKQTYSIAASGGARSGRVTPGSGLVSRFWVLEVANDGGCDFAVNNISAEITLSNRSE